MNVVKEASTTKGEMDLRLLLKVLNSVKKGDFSVRMPPDWTGVSGKIADTLNDIIELNEKLTRGIGHASEIVGKEGKLTERVSVGHIDGAWARKIDAVNALILDLARPTIEMARVIGAVAKGDLTQRMVLEASAHSQSVVATRPRRESLWLLPTTQRCQRHAGLPYSCR